MGRFHVKKLSKSAAAILAGIIWTILVSFPIPAKAQGPHDEASLKKFLQAYFASKDDDKTTRYIAAFHDLNGDGKPEALVYISGPHGAEAAAASFTFSLRRAVPGRSWQGRQLRGLRSGCWPARRMDGTISPSQWEAEEFNQATKRSFASMAKSILAIRLSRPPVERQKMRQGPFS